MNNEKWKIMNCNVVETKSFEFAVRIVNLHKYLKSKKKEFTLAKQILRSGTSIGANIAEAQQAQSKADFIAKMSIALKETAETKYWLRLLLATEYLESKEFQSILFDCSELERLLVSILKTCRQEEK